jgi:hypothetical protein
MRIAIVHWSRRKAGGAESYLEIVIPALASLGHEIVFWHEVDEPAGHESIALPENIPVWCARSLGATCALQALRDWRPDLIYAHGVHDTALEAEVLRIAPVVFLFIPIMAPALAERRASNFQMQSRVADASAGLVCCITARRAAAV